MMLKDLFEQNKIVKLHHEVDKDNIFLYVTDITGEVFKVTLNKFKETENGFTHKEIENHILNHEIIYNVDEDIHDSEDIDSMQLLDDYIRKTLLKILI